jgi:hypothetical protein
MKSLLIPVVALALILSGCKASSSTAGDNTKASKNEKKDAQFEQMVTLIEGGEFEYTVQSANPMGGKSIQITSSYTMEATGGVYKAYLPYFGQAHNASYGGDGGVQFEGEPTDLKIDKNSSKRTISITFSIKNKDESLNCNLVTGGGGNGTLTIISSKRSTISYYGIVSAIGD